MTSIATGQGAVRRMHFAPPTCNQLDHVASSLTGPSLSARVCCLFVNGAFGVWELDSRNELRAVGCLCLVLIAGHAFKVLSGGGSVNCMHSCVLCAAMSVLCILRSIMHCCLSASGAEALDPFDCHPHPFCMEQENKLLADM